MQKRTFLILDIVVQLILGIITIYIALVTGEFLEYDAFTWFLVLGFWQLITALVKHYYYKILMKSYFKMVRNFGIVLISVILFGLLLSQINAQIASIIFILLFIILFWSIILAVLYLYLSIMQLIDKEDVSLYD